MKRIFIIFTIILIVFFPLGIIRGEVRNFKGWLVSGFPEIGVSYLPEEGQKITDVSLSFLWLNYEKYGTFYLECSKDSKFKSGVYRKKIWATGQKRFVFIPWELLAPGKWYWRIGEKKNNGVVYSEMHNFFIEDKLTPKPLVRNFSPENPSIEFVGLYISKSKFKKLYFNIPSQIRPYCIFSLGLSTKYNIKKTKEILHWAEELGVPIRIQIDSPDWPIAVIEKLFQEHENLIGIQICERAILSGNEKEWPKVKQHISRLIKLCAKYGRTLKWDDENMCGHPVWLRVGSDIQFCKTIKKFKDYLIPTWELETPVLANMAHNCILGIWLSDMVTAWGIEPQDWYWHVAKYSKNVKDMPISMFGQIAILGMSSGATVYSLESVTPLFNREGDLEYLMKKVYAPLFKIMIEEKLIPTKEEVRKKIKIVYHADFSSDKEIKKSNLVEKAKMIYHGVFNNSWPYQVVPGTGKYYWLPIFPRYTPKKVLNSYSAVIKPNQFKDGLKAKKFFDQYYTKYHYKGTAWIVKCGKGIYVSHTKDKEDIEQNFEVSLKDKIKIEGVLPIHSYLVIIPKSSGNVRIHTNGLPEKNIFLRIIARKLPNVEVTPEKGLSSKKLKEKELELVISYKKGAVNLILNFKK